MTSPSSPVRGLSPQEILALGGRAHDLDTQWRSKREGRGFAPTLGEYIKFAEMFKFLHQAADPNRQEDE